MGQWSCSSLYCMVEAMVWHQAMTSTSVELSPIIPSKHESTKSYSNFRYFHFKEKAFEKDVCKMLVSLCSPQCLNMMPYAGTELESHSNIMLTLYVMNRISVKHKYVSAFNIIPRYWNITGWWVSLSWKTRISTIHILNIMAADALTTQGARASAGMLLTKFPWNIPSLTPKELTHHGVFIGI